MQSISLLYRAAVLWTKKDWNIIDWKGGKNLQARVDLQEVEFVGVLVHQELYGARGSAIKNQLCFCVYWAASKLTLH